MRKRLSRSTGYWRRLEHGPATGLYLLADMIARFDLAHLTALPDLTDSRTLLAATDASGEHKKAAYLTFGMLLIAYDQLHRWLDTMGELRNDLLDNRRLSFKSRRDRQRLRALLPFLNVAGELRGILLILAIHRDAGSLFDKHLPEADTSFLRSLRTWPPHILEQAGVFSHLLGVLLAGSSSPGANVLWLLDEGAIAAHERRLSELTQLAASITSQYLPFSLGTLQVATTKADDGSLAVEDLCSIPDLAAGAWSEFIQACDQSNFNITRDEQWPQLSLSPKTQAALSWWSMPGHTLTRLAFTYRKLGTGQLAWSLVSLKASAAPPNS